MKKVENYEQKSENIEFVKMKIEIYRINENKKMKWVEFCNEKNQNYRIKKSKSYNFTF